MLVHCFMRIIWHARYVQQSPFCSIIHPFHLTNAHLLLSFPAQDLSNKDMKRDLYIVSQVIRTGEYPVACSLSPLPTIPRSIHFLYFEPNVEELP